ncbi:5-formyltetrahydrofolate cyclo-ligase [Candidatus Parabeggiatoa sp. HSG14]|uniref:5-formyltetrahydrofolate cyclo-ligase n=1 Tax=Candidatus Parabeggiatoa sp. HSG14 TaxID=3055593 RepID=UPI0025A920A7|nr:5-formyltetrahydrofolate cyclo-ligase [Thiotrichales bacterium HSG14]
MKKEQLRKQFLEKRKNLNQKFLQEQSLTISHNFFNCFDLRQMKAIHIFLPILKQNEINTWLIINEMRQNHPHITPIVSKSNFQTYSMESYVLDNETKIKKNQRGIPEPINAKGYPNEMIDMILLPLLCFDKLGFRVGYGKGFYDRFLSKCRKDVIKIGLSLFEPIDKIENINIYDMKMDFCVMTEWVWH